MKIRKSLSIAAALVFAVGVADARAGLIKIDNGTLGMSIDDVAGPNEIGNLYLDGVAGDYIVLFTLLESESGYVNKLVETADDTELIEGPGGSGVGATTAYVHSGIAGMPTLLEFKFVTLAPAYELVNGSNNAANVSSFRVNLDPDVANGVLIGLDDSGAGPDKDFNDWFGKISITRRDRGVPSVAVPDGGSALALLGIALTGFGMVRRRLS